MARPFEELELVPPELEGLVARMARLAEARDGWINLLPGIPSELAEEQPPPSALSALFGSNTLPVTMATWTPTGPRNRVGERTVGVLHGRGRRALPELAQVGIAVPAGWRLRQDHQRRGLVLAVPDRVPHEEVVRWLLLVTEALASVPLTGRWKAQIYLPRSTTS